MKLRHAAVPLLALAIAAPLPAIAQTTTKTEVKHDTDVNNGVVTHTRTAVHVTKHKTHRPKKILGVKVGHKTKTTKVVHKTSTSSNGETTNSVKTTH
ncbi:hypothetical protein [uncultured Sphingomonas sp.]|uniref:hypothetical protein n=1 Tax=uncultured Sphingomonas sp. TaxID=158754 RepID=UPI0035CA25C8